MKPVTAEDEGVDVLSLISTASSGIIQQSQEEANVGSMLSGKFAKPRHIPCSLVFTLSLMFGWFGVAAGVSAVVTAITPTRDCNCADDETCFPDTGSCLGPVDAVWGEWSEWSACSFACVTAEQPGVEMRTRECKPPLLGGKTCAQVATEGGFSADTRQERACTAAPTCDGTVINAQVGEWQVTQACNATCGLDAAGEVVSGYTVYSRSCSPPSPTAAACPATVKTEVCTKECPLPPLPCPGRRITEVVDHQIVTTYMECSNQGSCVRSLEDCTEEDVGCTAVCACDDGWYGSDCSLTASSFEQLKGIRGSLLSGIESLPAADDDEAQSQQAGALEGVSNDVNQLGDEQRERVLALIGDITSFLGARRRRLEEGQGSSVSNQTGTSYTNAASSIMNQYIEDTTATNKASRLLWSEAIGARHLAKGSWLRGVVNRIAAAGDVGLSEARHRLLSGAYVDGVLLTRAERAHVLLAYVDSLHEGAPHMGAHRLLSLSSGHDAASDSVDPDVVIHATLRHLVEETMERAKAAVTEGVDLIKGVVGNVVADTVANSEPVVMGGKHVTITSSRSDETSKSGGSVSSPTGSGVTMSESFSSTVDTQVLEWTFNPRAYADNGTRIVAKVVTVELLDTARSTVPLSAPAILRLPVKPSVDLEDFKCAYGVETEEGWDRRGLALVRFTNATGHTVTAYSSDVAFGECASTHFSDFSYLKIPGLPTFNIVSAGSAVNVVDLTSMVVVGCPSCRLRYPQVNPFTEAGLLSSLFDAENLLAAIWLLSLLGFFVILWLISIYGDWRNRHVLNALRQAMYLRYGKITEKMLDYWAYEKFDPQVQDLLRNTKALQKLKDKRAKRLREQEARRVKVARVNTLTALTSSLWREWWTRMKSEHIWMAIYTAPTDERILLTTPQRIWMMACIVFMAMAVNAVFTGEGKLRMPPLATGPQPFAPVLRLCSSYLLVA